jgi:hypothetical protein
MNRTQFDSLGRDLFAEIGECDCIAFPDSVSLAHFKKKVWLTGYADDYFFDQVNAEPREIKCKCGAEFIYQWRRDGVWWKRLARATGQANVPEEIEEQADCPIHGISKGDKVCPRC